MKRKRAATNEWEISFTKWFLYGEGMKPLKKFFSGTVFFGHVKCDKYLNIETIKFNY